MKLMETPVASDEQLWLLACRGDREAFSRIVERYQSLVCSLAYSACGTLGTSEDMAQETFITAWHQLKDLRDPTKLRSWLCGIVRNIAANAVRRDLRRGEPVSLEVVGGELFEENDPVAQTITREEETLVWRTLSELPASYREPLILFYREDHSVAEVALKLDLTEDTVKQRLSRGRAMLREEVATVVESVLARTQPTATFTAGVLAALAFAQTKTSAAITTGAIAGKGAAAVSKSALGGLGLGAIAGPAMGLFIGLFSSKAAALTARSSRERECISRNARRIVIFCFVMSIGLAATLSQAGKLYSVTPGWLIFGVCAWVTALVLIIHLWSTRMQREVVRIRAETGTDDQTYSEKLAGHGLSLDAPKLYESRTRFLGLPLVVFAYGGNDADSYRPRTVCGWIALGDRALSPFLAVGGLAVAPIALGGVTVGILSLSFWGVGVGALALGSIAIGWWAFGPAAAGWKCAAGGVTLAHDYALGWIAQARVANTSAAKEWFRSQWFTDLVNVFLHQAHWWILLIIVISLALRVRRGWQLRRLSR